MGGGGGGGGGGGFFLAPTSGTHGHSRISTKITLDKWKILMSLGRNPSPSMHNTVDQPAWGGGCKPSRIG